MALWQDGKWREDRHEFWKPVGLGKYCFVFDPMRWFRYRDHVGD